MIRALTAFLMLAACAAPPPPAMPGPLVPAEDGIDVGGTELQIGFGRSEEGAIAAASKLLGLPPDRRAELGSCSRAVWKDGFTMSFRQRAFIGWTDPKARGGALNGGETC